MLILIIIFACLYLAVAALAYKWLAPNSLTYRTDHVTAALAGLFWPISVLWLLVVCIIEVCTSREPEEY